MKFKIEEFPNPELIEIHLTKQIDSKDHNRFFNAVSALVSNDPDNIKDLVRALFEVPGVTQVTVNQYSITIDKGKCFEWEEIIPKVTSTIEVMLTTDEEQLEELPRISLTPEERVSKLKEAEDYFKNNRFGGSWLF